MAEITWLGEGESGPQETRAYGDRRFRVGEPVEINDEAIIRKARGNRLFEVSGEYEEPEEQGPADEEEIAGLVANASGTPVAIGDVVKNAGFGTEEELRAHAEATEAQLEEFEKKLEGTDFAAETLEETVANAEPAEGPPARKATGAKKTAAKKGAKRGAKKRRRGRKAAQNGNGDDDAA
jgi:hypothetical protein